ncbi:MAG: hypothetical protein P8Y70_03295 [Candidatus Lokiarchaeota archaeon]
MSKDLKDVLDNIESSEQQTAKLQAKIDRLTELIERQKKIISEQETIIEEQKSKQHEMVDIPEDIMDLKEIIGEQRALLNEREVELEHAKGSKAQIEKEYELFRNQMDPLEKNITNLSK